MPCLFIKFDMAGTNDSFRRAGLQPGTPALEDLIRLVEDSPNVELYGLYTYSPAASNGCTPEEAKRLLTDHVQEVLRVAELVRDKTQPLVLSVGSSPTANVLGPVMEKVPANISFEIHAGNQRA